MLSLPRWLKHDESNIFFIVSGDLTKAFAKMPELAASGISFSMFKKILNGELKEKAGWRRHEQPAFVETLSDGASLAGPIIDYQHQKVEIVPVEQRGAAVPPRQVRAHGSRRVGGWVAASRAVTLTSCVLAPQMPTAAPSPGEVGGLGSFGRRAQVRWRV